MNVVRGVEKRTSESARSNGASTGSIIGECDAYATRSGATRTPLAAKCDAIASSADVDPLTTTCSGPLYAAMVAPAPACASAISTSAAGAKTVAIPPVAGSESTKRVRSTTIRKASSSVVAPATCAAAYSPRLWPSTAAGSTPHERQSAASAISVATSAGWPNRV